MGEIMIEQSELNTLNEAFKNASPAEINSKAFELSDKAVVTTNFRPYEAAILHAVSTVKANNQWFGAIQVTIRHKHISMQSKL